MKLFILFTVLVFGLNSFAKEIDYTCQGKDRKGYHLIITFNSGVDSQQSARADVKIISDGADPVQVEGLSVYTDNEGGFDYGVTSDTDAAWMLHLILLPNMLGTGKVAARYYYGNDFSIKNSVVLNCEEGLN